MTSLRLLLAGLLGACCLVFLTPSASHACSCVMANTDDYVDWADAIFTGTLVEVTPPPERDVESSTDPVTYAFDVDTVQKGDVGPTAEVSTARWGASCGLEGLEVGTSYVVFATGAPGAFHASLCGGTGLAGPGRVAAVDRALGPGRAPTTISLQPGLGVPRDWW